MRCAQSPSGLSLVYNVVTNGIVVDGKGGERLLQEKKRPILNGMRPTMDTPLRATVNGPKYANDGSPWLAGIPFEIRGGLERDLIRQTDGETTIIRSRPKPWERRELPSPIAPGEEAPVCIPVAVSSISVSPVKDPYDVGDEITCTAFGVSGTTPISYEWFLNGVSVSTSETFVHTLVEADVTNKDPSGLGITKIYVVLTNDCGTDSTDPDAAINVQGDPP